MRPTSWGWFGVPSPAVLRGACGRRRPSASRRWNTAPSMLSRESSVAYRASQASGRGPSYLRFIGVCILLMEAPSGTGSQPLLTLHVTKHRASRARQVSRPSRRSVPISRRPLSMLTLPTRYAHRGLALPVGTRDRLGFGLPRPSPATRPTVTWVKSLTCTTSVVELLDPAGGRPASPSGSLFVPVLRRLTWLSNHSAVLPSAPGAFVHPAVWGGSAAHPRATGAGVRAPVRPRAAGI